MDVTYLSEFKLLKEDVERLKRRPFVNSDIVPFVVYSILPANVSASPADPWAATIWRPLTIFQWIQSWFVVTTNDGSNYWTFDLRDVSTSIATFTTAAGAASTWNQSTVNFSQALTATNRLLVIRATKTGSPGNFYSTGPIVWYRPD